MKKRNLIGLLNLKLFLPNQSNTLLSSSAPVIHASNQSRHIPDSKWARESGGKLFALDLRKKWRLRLMNLKFVLAIQPSQHCILLSTSVAQRAINQSLHTQLFPVDQSCSITRRSHCVINTRTVTMLDSFSWRFTVLISLQFTVHSSNGLTCLYGKSTLYVIEESYASVYPTNNDVGFWANIR